MIPRFQALEASYLHWKAELEAGRMSPAQLDQQLEAAAIEHEGRWWMIGANSGKWYVSDGEQWLEASPPADPAPESIPTQIMVTPIRTPPLSSAPALPSTPPVAQQTTVPAPPRAGGIAMRILGWTVFAAGLPLSYLTPLGGRLLALGTLILSLDTMLARRMPTGLFFAGAVVLFIVGGFILPQIDALPWWFAESVRLPSYAAMLGGGIGFLSRLLFRTRA